MEKFRGSFGLGKKPKREGLPHPDASDPVVAYRRQFSAEVKRKFKQLEKGERNMKGRVQFSDGGRTVTVTGVKRCALDHDLITEVEVLSNPNDPDDFSSLRITKTTRSLEKGLLGQTVIGIFQTDQSGELIPLIIEKRIEKKEVVAQYGDVGIKGDVKLQRFAVNLEEGLFKAEVDSVQSVNILQNAEGVEIEFSQELPNTFIIKNEDFKSSVRKVENIGQILTDSVFFER